MSLSQETDRNKSSDSATTLDDIAKDKDSQGGAYTEAVPMRQIKLKRTLTPGKFTSPDLGT